MSRELAIDRQRTAARWRLALLVASSCAAAACAFEFDREWIDQPLGVDAGPGVAVSAPPQAVAAVDAGTEGAIPDSKAAAQAAGGTLSCAQIDECCAPCDEHDDRCCQGCFDAGTPAAQRAFDAVCSCIDTAIDGVCQSSCYDVSSDFCWDCADSACAAELQTCLCSAA